MQILHQFTGSVQQYLEQLSDPDQHRPACCPQCPAPVPLTAHGFYSRTIIDAAFDGVIRVRRYLCEACRRTVSLLPEFALPYLRSSLAVIAWWLMVHFLPASPPPAPAPNFVQRALAMLTTAGWTPAHRFLFADLRHHLLGWPPSLVPDGRRVTLPAAPA